MKFNPLLLALGLVLSSGCASLEHHTFSDEDGAIRGYDPVAYFTESRPVFGRSDITARHDGAVYHFASEENRELFEARPTYYAPQYGGYCAYAMSKGFVVSSDPNAWTIHNDKLYLNFSLSVRKTWLKRKAEYIEKADRHWKKKIADGLDA